MRIRISPQLAVSASAVVSSGPVLLIDPGHGGMDGGAVAADGTRESVLNLAVCQKLQFLAGLFGAQVTMSRLDEELDYPVQLQTIREKKVWDQKRRAELFGRDPEAVVISVHQNNFPDPRPFGAQVYYAKSDGSEELAKLAQERLTAALLPGNRRVAAPVGKDIYLMKQLSCTGILVECGFLSNHGELSKLKSEFYQQQLAMVLLSAYIQYQSGKP